jgi:hypothetical protein
VRLSTTRLSIVLGALLSLLGGFWVVNGPPLPLWASFLLPLPPLLWLLAGLLVHSLALLPGLRSLLYSLLTLWLSRLLWRLALLRWLLWLILLLP